MKAAGAGAVDAHGAAADAFAAATESSATVPSTTAAAAAAAAAGTAASALSTTAAPVAFVAAPATATAAAATATAAAAAAAAVAAVESTARGDTGEDEQSANPSSGKDDREKGDAGGVEDGRGNGDAAVGAAAEALAAAAPDPWVAATYAALTALNPPPPKTTFAAPAGDLAREDAGDDANFIAEMRRRRAELWSSEAGESAALASGSTCVSSQPEREFPSVPSCGNNARDRCPRLSGKPPFSTPLPKVGRCRLTQSNPR
jgi:hypothetical protein